MLITFFPLWSKPEILQIAKNGLIQIQSLWKYQIAPTSNYAFVIN